MKTKNLKFICDPGHGWLSVSLKDLTELDVLDKISSYSYMTTSRAYLEEDCDASIFLNAAKAKGWTINTQNSHVDSTPIRGYASFDAQKVSLAFNLDKNTDVLLYNTSQKQWTTKAVITDILDNQVFLQCEHGHQYKVSKNKFLSVVQPSPEKPKLKM